MKDSDREGRASEDDPTEFRSGDQGEDPTELRSPKDSHEDGPSDADPGAGEDRTELRKAEAEDKDDATQLRRGAGTDDAEIDPTELLQDADRPEATDDSGRVDLPLGEDSGEVDLPLHEDEDERTQIRSSASDEDEQDDRTALRGQPAGGGAKGAGAEEEGEEERTVLRGRPAADEQDEGEERTQLRGDRDAAGEDDEFELTQLRGSVTDDAADLDPTLPMADAGGASEEDEDRTRARERPDPDEADEATELRAGADDLPGDDDPTITARVSGRDQHEVGAGDDDATLQAQTRGQTRAPSGGQGPIDDDATVRADDPTLKAAAGSGPDDDATVRAQTSASSTTTATATSADDDPTVQGTAAATDGKAAAKPAAQMLGSGTVLKGRFVLEDKLGEGGMGGVYKAVDLVKQEARDRNPHVAVKVLNENFAEHPDAFIALQRESSRTQRLSHPNIASVYDFDRDGQTAYMVMELMQGDPLDKFLKQHKQGVSKEQAFSIIKDMASALAYAHGQHLIHSDFKPGNIFLTASGAAKVFDFGIARAAAAPGEEKAASRGPISETTLSSDDGTDKTLFDAGQLGALTPAYAACEMFEGKDPAPQDDVYALGIVAYQLLTGRHPFDRKKAPIAEAQDMVALRPDGLTRREWNALKHSLAFRREDRTPDAQAFLDEFFGVAGSGLKYALVTAAGMAAVIAGLYFGGVIGPGEAPIEVPREWVELDTRIDNARSGVEEQLAAPIFSPVWEEFLQRDIRRWEEAATPVIVAGEYADAAAAESTRRQVFEQIGIPLRVESPARSGGSYRLLAGPFGGDAADRERADYLRRLQGFGIDAVEESESGAIARARDQALGIYLAEIDRLMPPEELPSIPTVRDGERFVADPDRVESARNRVADVREAQEVLSRATERYPTRPEVLEQRSEQLQSLRTQWQDHIDQAIARASSRQAEEDRAELVAQQREQAERERQRAYEAKRDDRVFPAFAGRCHQPGEIEAVLEDFQSLRSSDQQQALRYATECASSRVTRSPTEVLQSRSLILAVAEHAELAAIEAPDPCSSRTYIGNGRSSFCLDELASGGNAPPVVVVPGRNNSGIYGIGKYEVSVREFNQFCEATDCGSPAEGGARMPATGISADHAKRYAEWLSEQTGFTYRLPTEQEWLHAADADGSPLDSNRNCYSNVRGVVRGESLVAVTQGTPNAWGLINHVGNAQEWVLGSNGQLLAVGGKHSDPLSECTLESRSEHSGRGDGATGFRVLREIR